MHSLNPEQKRAVETVEGPVLILAGAGAGKTKTITERIRHLISRGVAPSSILAITFTNKAAREMRDRIEARLQSDASINRPIFMPERPFVSTFHSLGVHILREQAHRAGLKKHFSIFDRDDSKKLVKECLIALGLDPKTHEPGAILSIISKLKGRGLTQNEWESVDTGGYFMDVVGQVWPLYEKSLERENALDFDDLLLKTRNLLESENGIKDYYRKVWRYIHIDEYQDTNRVQYEICQMLVGDEQNICVVGDIDQNIYSWRGADIKNILAFEEDYPGSQVIILEENYRSTKTILEAANAVIEKNKIRRKKNLFTENAAGEKIGIHVCLDEESEADFIASKAKTLIGENIPPEEIAVLYRANFQSRILEEAFLKLGVPYQVLGTRFFERKEVKDIISYLRAALNPDSLSDLKRVINTPARGIGKTSIVKIFSGGEVDLPLGIKTKVASFRKLLARIAESAKTNKVSETILFIIKESGLEDEYKESGEEGAARLENAYELVNFAAKYKDFSPEEGILAFLSETALQSDQDELKDEKKAVRLMTIHAAKGLEFDTVFVAGLEDGLFPHAKANESRVTPEEAEEERRLFYVALTRARKKVYLTYAQTRMLFGRSRVNIPSEFILDIPENLTEEDTYKESPHDRKPLLEIEF